jgi:hypothetical protein
MVALADPLGGPQPVPDARAYAVNNPGQVVGAYCIGSDTFRPVRWDSPEAVTPLGFVAPYAGATPLRLNDAGEAVGALKHPGFDDRAVKWDVAGAPTTLALPAGYAAGRAWSFNASVTAMGDVSVASSSASHAAKWTSDGAVSLLQELPEMLDRSAAPFSARTGPCPRPT